MNAQLPITTTPKYNFPFSEENICLPQKFMELSISSLKKLQPIQPFTESMATSLSTTNTCTKYQKNCAPSTKLFKLEPDRTDTSIVAIDVSSIKLGETKTGILLAVRGAIVWKQADSYRYLRVGPFPFHASEKNKDKIYNRLHQHSQVAHNQKLTTFNLQYIQTRLTTLLERWIQASINQTTRNSLILWDGCLMAGTPETPTKTMAQLLAKARTNGNVILAFSKMTRLFLFGHRITDLVWKHPPPCLVLISNYSDRAGSMHLLGNLYVAKLTVGNCAFRLDVDKELAKMRAIEAVKKLLGNDLFQQSYPETLRLAHIFSTFTANEVLGLQRCIAKESNLKIITRLNLRRLLFGRFGKGSDG
ncbi:MAG: hypothetical protein JSV51_02245 [Candidatus Bathyarchaeota archaeon]|nr:MAG: hypothetical protein JSV51_02245 [Candidatus Bathyarchaeota archaeon]